MPLGPEDITLTGKTLTGGTISGSTISGGNLTGVGPSTIGGIRVTTAVVAPNTNDGVALGTTADKFSDLFLASGGVVQFSTEGTNITHSASALTVNSPQLTLVSSLAVTGNSSLTGTLHLTGNCTHAGTNQLTGACTIGGVLTLTTGNIQFPGTQIANAGANVLDDYEEGGFAPTFTPATTGTFTIGYNAATTANYTKIGDRVIVSGFVSVTTHTSGNGTGQMGISSLPFAARANGAGFFNVASATSGYRAFNTALITTAASVARAQLAPTATTGVTSALNLADLTTGANTFHFRGHYGI